MNDEEHHLYLKYDCFGRYMELGKPWTNAKGKCSQTCAKRLTCYVETKKRKSESK